MPSSSFLCRHPELCEGLVEDLLALGPTPSRSEYERDPTLVLLSGLYAEEFGLEFLANMESFLARISQIYVFSRTPTLGQIQAAIDKAYVTTRQPHLHCLLRAFSFFWPEASRASAEVLNAFAARVSRGLAPPSSLTNLCGGCGAVDSDFSQSCTHCGSGTFQLFAYEVPGNVYKGLKLHIPSELYAVQALESAGYHVIRSERADGSAISLTFKAFGVRVDVDAIGIGHPACVVLLSVTTSKVDQGKAMRTKGTLETLVKMFVQRMRKSVPVHIVLATTDAVDENLDVVGLERAGMTIYDHEQIPVLAEELSKIPSRLPHQ